MTDTKASAAFHPYATREEALEAEVRALRGERDDLIRELAQARGCTENAMRTARGLTP